MSSPESKINELKIKLPSAPNPVANYVPLIQTGNLLFVSGNGPGLKNDKSPFSGKPGMSISEEEAIDASYSVGLNILSQVKKHTGTLDNVSRVIRVFGMINSSHHFKNHSKINYKFWKGTRNKPSKYIKNEWTNYRNNFWH